MKPSEKLALEALLIPVAPTVIATYCMAHGEIALMLAAGAISWFLWWGSSLLIEAAKMVLDAEASAPRSSR